MFERDMGFNKSGVWNNVPFNLMEYKKKSFKRNIHNVDCIHNFLQSIEISF